MPNMDSIRLKTKELQSKMYLTQTHRLRLINSDSFTHSTHKSGQLLIIAPTLLQTPDIRGNTVSGVVFKMLPPEKPVLSMYFTLLSYVHTLQVQGTVIY